jgi:hypothetical protein
MGEIAAPKQRGRPFPKGQSGNPAGKPPGTRNRATQLAERLLDGEAEDLTRMVIGLAKAGDTTALKLCLDRLLPPRKDRPIWFELPAMTTAADASRAMAAITAAVAAGQVTPAEAEALGNLVATFARTLESSELEARLIALEQWAENRK